MDDVVERRIVLSSTVSLRLLSIIDPERIERLPPLASDRVFTRERDLVRHLYEVSILWAYDWDSVHIFAQILFHLHHHIKTYSILELGCGNGAVGISAALSGASSVLLTDFSPLALSHASKHIHLNGVQDRCKIAALDWFAPPTGFLINQYDLLLGSDVVYNSEKATRLAEIVSLGIRQGGTALFVDCQSRFFSNEFEGALRKNGLNFRKHPIEGFHEEHCIENMFVLTEVWGIEEEERSRFSRSLVAAIDIFLKEHQ